MSSSRKFVELFPGFRKVGNFSLSFIMRVWKIVKGWLGVVDLE